MLKLNLGCGKSKFDGFINIDIEKSVEPDLVHDFRVGLPYKEGEVDEIWMIHVIEHIEEVHHLALLNEFHRVLKVGGKLVFCYPEFPKCANNYLTNYKGLRDFWKHTIFGRQLYPGDYHVALMDSTFFIRLVQSAGFTNVKADGQKGYEDHYSILTCEKSQLRLSNREELIRREAFTLEHINT